MSEINLSEWTIDRINAEQEKHKVGLIAHGIPVVDLSKVDYTAFDTISNAIDTIARRATEEQELFIICELAKRYVESQRPAKWIEVDDGLVSGRCSLCGWEAVIMETDVCGMPFCPNCGRRMKNG